MSGVFGDGQLDDGTCDRYKHLVVSQFLRSVGG